MDFCRVQSFHEWEMNIAFEIRKENHILKKNKTRIPDPATQGALPFQPSLVQHGIGLSSCSAFCQLCDSGSLFDVSDSQSCHQ